MDPAKTDTSGTSLSSAWDLVALKLGTITHLFVADGRGGIYDCDTFLGSDQCSSIGLSSSGGNDWARIDGTGTSTSDVTLYTACTADGTANCTSPNVETYGGCGTSCAWSGFDTRTDLLNGGDGDTDPRWWLPANQPDYDLQGKYYVGAQVLVDTTDTSGTRIYLAGRAGVWRYDSGLATKWAPVPDGLTTTLDHAVAAEPFSAGQGQDAVDADEDWSALVSDAHLQCCDDPAPPGTSQNDQPTNDNVTGAGYGTAALSVAVEPNGATDSYIFVGIGDAPGSGSCGDGKVEYCETNPATGTPCSQGGWTTLPAIGNGNAVIGLAVGKAPGDTKMTIIAAVAGSGIWFLHDKSSSTWHQASSAIGRLQSGTILPANDHIDIQFSDGSTYAYVFAPSNNFPHDYFGLFKSTSIVASPTGWTFGSTETSLYGSLVTSPDAPRVNHMAGEAGLDPGYLYLTDQTEAVRLNTATDATTKLQLCPSIPCSSGTDITSAKFFYPGPVTVDSSGVPYLVNDAPDGTSGGRQADVYQGSAGGGYYTTAVGGAGYRQQILFASGIAVSGDSYLYVSSPSGGVAVAPPG